MIRKLNSYLARKGTLVFLLATIIFLILIANYFVNWSFLNRTTANFENQLSTHIELLAKTTAEKIELEILQNDIISNINTLSPQQTLLVKFLIEGERADNELQSIFLANTSFESIVSSPEIYMSNSLISHLQSDSLLFRAATNGEIVSSVIYEVDGNRFKSAYAPVRNEFGVIAVVVVEASANFFSVLANFQNVVVVGFLVTLALFAIVIVLIYWVVSQYTKVQRSAQHNERLAAMGQMAATVAHEIRNPLGIIKSTAEVLQSKFASQQSSELFTFIPTEVDRLNRLITDFLSFARNRDLQLEKANIVNTISDTIQKIKQDQANNKIAFHFNKDLSEFLVLHDVNAFKQVLLNILQNAIQAMDANGEIFIELNNVSTWGNIGCEIVITDKGPGVKNSDKLFEPFFTTKTNGSGLGLAVSKQIIVKHKGDITAANAPDGGARFTIKIPL